MLKSDKGQYIDIDGIESAPIGCRGIRLIDFTRSSSIFINQKIKWGWFPSF